MTMKRGITCFLSGIFFLCMVSQAQAIPVEHGISGTFTDTGTIFGTITFDTMNPPFPAVLVGLNLVTTTNGSFTGDTYDINSVLGATINNQFLALVTGISGNSLFLSYSPALVLGGGPSLVSFVEMNSGVSRDASGVVATPEPGTILLFGSGLMGLAAWRMRKNKANQ